MIFLVYLIIYLFQKTRNFVTNGSHSFSPTATAGIVQASQFMTISISFFPK